MRDYKHIDRYLNTLSVDIYPQPPDPGHTAWAKDAIDRMIPGHGIGSALDVGCGEKNFCRTFFYKHGVEWVGIDFLRDGIDMSFLPYPDNSFDLIFARHVLEHSPMPLITLLEWYRVSRRFLFVILPTPEHWQVHGRNHYYVLGEDNWWVLFHNAGWKIIDRDYLWTEDEIFVENYLPHVKDKEERKRLWIKEPQRVEFRYMLEKI